MLLNNCLKTGVEALNKISLTPQLDAEVLLCFVLDRNRAWLLSHPEESLSEDQSNKYYELIDRRSKHEPIAYITGNKEFYGRNFIVTPDVLIPRPESEQIIELLKDNNSSEDTLTLADIGTGSGCLAITAALEFPNATIYGLDISEDALTIADKNKKALKAINLSFEHSDLLRYLIDEKIKIDVLIANLPYLTKQDIDESPTSSDLSFEPQGALLSDDDGLFHIKKCIDQADQILNPNGHIYFEMLPEQIPRFIEWIKENNFPYSCKTPNDLKGKKRIVVLKK